MGTDFWPPLYKEFFSGLPYPKSRQSILMLSSRETSRSLQIKRKHMKFNDHTERESQN